MKICIHKPYKLVWASIPVIMFFALAGMNSRVDIQMHDTYLVTTAFHIGVLFSVILAIIGFLYWLVRKVKLLSWMTVAHLIFMFVPLILIMIKSLFFEAVVPSDTESFSRVNQIVFSLILISSVGHLIFICNLIASFVRTRLIR